MATGRNQKGMDRRNHHDSLGASGRQKPYTPKPGKSAIEKGIDNFFNPRPSRSSGSSPFKSKSGGRNGNKKPWGLG